jgi:hypothetical protein
MNAHTKHTNSRHTHARHAHAMQAHSVHPHIMHDYFMHASHFLCPGLHSKINVGINSFIPTADKVHKLGFHTLETVAGGFRPLIFFFHTDSGEQDSETRYKVVASAAAWVLYKVFFP